MFGKVFPPRRGRESVQDGDAAKVEEHRGDDGGFWGEQRLNKEVLESGRGRLPCVLIIKRIARCRCSRASVNKHFVSPATVLCGDRY